MHEAPTHPVDVKLTLMLPEALDRHAAAGSTTRITWGSSQKDAFKLRAIFIVYPSVASAQAGHHILYMVTGLVGLIVLSTSLLSFAPVPVGAREGGMFNMCQCLSQRQVARKNLAYL